MPQACQTAVTVSRCPVVHGAIGKSGHCRCIFPLPPPTHRCGPAVNPLLYAHNVGFSEASNVLTQPLYLYLLVAPCCSGGYAIVSIRNTAVSYHSSNVTPTSPVVPCIHLSRPCQYAVCRWRGCHRPSAFLSRILLWYSSVLLQRIAKNLIRLSLQSMMRAANLTGAIFFDQHLYGLVIVSQSIIPLPPVIARHISLLCVNIRKCSI